VPGQVQEDLTAEKLPASTAKIDSEETIEVTN